MTSRWSRMLPLTAIVFAVLGLAGLFAAPSTPGPHAGGASVIAFYTTHQSAQQATDLTLTLAFISFVFFAGSLRSYLRDAPQSEGASAVLLAGAAITAVGFMIFTGVDWALADLPSKLTPSAAQTLNLIDNDLTFPFRAGMCVFGLASGVAVLRHAGLPRWSGWVPIAIGILSATPLYLLAVMLLIAWSIAVGVLLYRRLSNGQATGTTHPDGESRSPDKGAEPQTRPIGGRR